jgi:hypothetical protein
MIRQNLPIKEHGEKLNKVIDRVLNQIFGQEAVQIIYEYLEKNHYIQRHEIAEKFDSFNYALREYLGTGALVIEKVILDNLELYGFEQNKCDDFAERQKIIKLT